MFRKDTKKKKKLKVPESKVEVVEKEEEVDIH
jgi:hypothetical protein